MAIHFGDWLAAVRSMRPRVLVPILVAAALVFIMAGCTTKNYVRSQTAPLADKANQLDAQARTNNNAIHDVDSRAQHGIAGAQSAADQAQQNANSAQSAANTAQQSADNSIQQVGSLRDVIANLDSYKTLSSVDVHFATGSAELSRKDREQLDGLGEQISQAHGYILEVTGATDSTGSAELNYDLSQRRAHAVVQYLATKYNVEPRRFYLIGIGKDQSVATNRNASGRAQNRRVAIRLLSNTGTQPAPPPTATASSGGF